MGTNFYWHENICDACGRHQEIHVGKRSAGWSFAFRGYRHQLPNAEHPEWGYLDESPFGFAVDSRVDWRRVFTERAGQLINEYGTPEEDPVAWVDGLKAPDLAQIRIEAELTGPVPSWMSATTVADLRRRDAEGFRVTYQEFS